MHEVSRSVSLSACQPVGLSACRPVSLLAESCRRQRTPWAALRARPSFRRSTESQTTTFRVLLHIPMLGKHVFPSPSPWIRYLEHSIVNTFHFFKREKHINASNVSSKHLRIKHTCVLFLVLIFKSSSETYLIQPHFQLK